MYSPAFAARWFNRAHVLYSLLIKRIEVFLCSSFVMSFSMCQIFSSQKNAVYFLDVIRALCSKKDINTVKNYMDELAYFYDELNIHY